MPRTFSTVRELIYWEYAKLISEKAVGDRMNYKFINFTGAIQSKPAALFGASSNSPALFKENRYVCIGSVGPLPGTGRIAKPPGDDVGRDKPNRNRLKSQSTNFN